MLPASSLLDTPAASLNDPDWAAAARQALQQADARLYRRFDQGDNIERLLALRAQMADLLHDADTRVQIDDAGIGLTRRAGKRQLIARLDLPGGAAAADDGAAILDWHGPDGCRVHLREA